MERGWITNEGITRALRWLEANARDGIAVDWLSPAQAAEISPGLDTTGVLGAELPEDEAGFGRRWMNYYGRAGSFESLSRRQGWGDT